jgi:hypothetical protein
MSDSKSTGVATLLDEATDRTDSTDRVAHLVMKADWPIALCGANVSEHLGIKAPAMDRCTDCLRIASTRGLGRPGWESQG